MTSIAQSSKKLDQLQIFAPSDPSNPNSLQIGPTVRPTYDISAYKLYNLFRLDVRITKNPTYATWSPHRNELQPFKVVNSHVLWEVQFSGSRQFSVRSYGSVHTWQIGIKSLYSFRPWCGDPENPYILMWHSSLCRVTVLEAMKRKNISKIENAKIGNFRFGPTVRSTLYISTYKVYNLFGHDITIKKSHTCWYRTRHDVELQHFEAPLVFFFP